MSEGARKGKSFIVVSLYPDICLTPMGPTMVPVPYQIVAFPKKADRTSPNVKFAGEPALLHDDSVIMHVEGNEAGVGGGVLSKCNRGIVEFDQGSENVRVNGQRVVRHNDECWMNGRNTRGKVICTDGMGPVRDGLGAANGPLKGNGNSSSACVTIKGIPPPVKVNLGPQATNLRYSAHEREPLCDT